MNSRQRRVNKRYWRHRVILKDDTTFEEYELIRKWCQEKFGKVGYRWGNLYCYNEFEFRNERDCTMFMLKWV